MVVVTEVSAVLEENRLQGSALRKLQAPVDAKPSWRLMRLSKDTGIPLRAVRGWHKVALKLLLGGSWGWVTADY